MPYKPQPKHKRLSDVLSHERTFKKSRALKQILAQASHHDSIEDRLDECLPELLRGELIVAGIEDQCLILHCRSAAIATRFRFEQDKTLKALQMRVGALRVQSIKIQIRPFTKKKTSNKMVKLKDRPELKNKTTEQRLDEALERLNSRSN